jgi:hypothetical protein
MRFVVAVALVAASLPGLAAATGRPETAPTERRHCTNIAVRAGSRLTGRRVCLTQTQWREALGPDWRQHLAGNRGVQDDYEAMMARVSPDNGVHGQQPRAGGLGAGGPH